MNPLAAASKLGSAYFYRFEVSNKTKTTDLLTRFSDKSYRLASTNHVARASPAVLSAPALRQFRPFSWR